MSHTKTCILSPSLIVLAILVGSNMAYGQNRSDSGSGRDSEVSPALKIERDGRPERRPPEDTGDPLVRTIDGSFNNLDNPEMGFAGAQLRRYVPSDYADGISDLAKPFRPGPREVSNAVAAQSSSIPNTLDASDWLWLWGQFLDHDIGLTDGTDPPEPKPIAVPVGDPYFDPDSEGGARDRVQQVDLRSGDRYGHFKPAPAAKRDHGLDRRVERVRFG